MNPTALAANRAAPKPKAVPTYLRDSRGNVFTCDANGTVRRLTPKKNKRG